MSKTAGKRDRGGTELFLLLALVALVLHFARAKRQVDIAAKEAREKAAREHAVELFEKLPTEAQDTISALSTTLLTGMVYGLESSPRVELWVADHRLKRDPDNIEWLRMRADAQVDLGELGLALKDLSRILELDPADYDALNWHAIYSGELGLREVAIADIEKLEQLFQKEMGTVPVRLLNTRASYLAEEGRFEDALVVAQKADSIEPNNVNTLNTLGYIYVGLGDQQAALEAYNRTIFLNPKSVYAP